MEGQNDIGEEFQAQRDDGEDQSDGDDDGDDDDDPPPNLKDLLLLPRQPEGSDGND